MIKSGKGYSYWLARFNRKISFHFPRVVPLISDRSVWHNGKQPGSLLKHEVVSLNHFRPSKQFEGRCGALFSLGFFSWFVYYAVHRAYIESNSMVASRNT